VGLSSWQEGVERQFYTSVQAVERMSLSLALGLPGNRREVVKTTPTTLLSQGAPAFASRLSL
jgi:hypothetical protein